MRGSKKSRKRRMKRQLRTEVLEQRTLMAASPFSFDYEHGTMFIQGTDQADVASVWEGHKGEIFAHLNGQSIRCQPGVQKIVFQGRKGDDRFVNLARIPSEAFGDGGNDILIGGPSRDTFHGGVGNDVLRGNSGDDWLFGDAGNDTLHGNAGNDTLVGGEHADLIYGNAGDDAISGGRGNDTIYGHEGKDTIFCEQGADTAFAGSGEDIVYGGTEDDALYGQEDDDHLVGGAGDDTLDGGDGNDRMEGKGGRDRIVDPQAVMLTDHFGGDWSDAEKIPADDGKGESTGLPGADDDWMCWAAAASNILEWTGWGQVANMFTTDQMFQYFQDHWTDYGGLMNYAWDWWFDGSNDSQGYADWSQVDVSGGGFFPNVDIDDYSHVTTDNSLVMDKIVNHLDAGDGVTLAVYNGWGGHAITCWGYLVDANDPNAIRGVFVTDSDDYKLHADPIDAIRYYDVSSRNGSWYLRDFYDSDSWHVGAVFALERRPSSLENADRSGSEKSSVSEGILPVGLRNPGRHVYHEKPTTLTGSISSSAPIPRPDRPTEELTDQAIRSFVALPRAMSALRGQPRDAQEATRILSTKPERSTDDPCDVFSKAVDKVLQVDLFWRTI